MGMFERKENSLIYCCNGETVLIEPWGRDSFRVRSSFRGGITEEVNALLPKGEGTTGAGGADAGDVEIVINDADDSSDTTAGGDRGSAMIRNGQITARCSVIKWNVNYFMTILYERSDGRKILSEMSFGGALQKRARDFTALPGGGFRLKASFAPEKGERIYGMGQYQQELLDLKGCNLELAQRNSQASVPFYVSSVGYGFLWNNAAVGEVSFGLNTTEWTANVTRQLDYWITVADTPAGILENYAAATGYVPMMPEYGLGFWQCKLRYYNQEQVLQVAREYKKRDITPDVIIIDYYHWPRCGDWRFDEEYFPDPESMVKQLKEMGIEPMVSVWPAVDWRSENYEEMKQKGYLVRSNGGIDVQMNFHGNNAFMDATNPGTREYVWEKVKKNYFDYGIKTFWLDVAEPEYGTYDFNCYNYYDGPVEQVGNEYPREYARLFYEGQKAAGQEDIVNLIRCAWAGSQRYGALVWSGDIYSTFEDLRKQICAGIQMGMSGMPWWNSDIGGFHNGDSASDAFKELLVRWFQFGTFCPVMRLHGCRLPYTPIVNAAGEEREQTGADNEIWSYGPEVEKILTHYIRIREAMKDYTREIMEIAHRTGAPVMRGLMYEFPEDEACALICDEYMYGPDILVAPICYEGSTSRSVYLPKGSFYIQADTGMRFEGGTRIEVAADMDTIPVFLRDGKQAFLRELLGK